ncbi:MAG TPA: SMI1/KNR4 family protein [Gemmataceae bacterium]|jgi:hypothetical protein|nr:SMI1/KNR4 family protein [Gemmataceae bacterium]
MIDFEQFWAETGCLPGMSKEETEAQLLQLANQYGPAAAGSFNPLADPMFNPGPGLSAEQIAEWEQERGVRLPDVLRQAFARQNGGFVYDTHLHILPLEEVANPDDDFWEFASYEEEEISDRSLVFRFAEEQECDGELFLNFNAGGPEGEPCVMSYHSDPGDLNRHAKSVTRFLTRMLETFEAPSVDWSETGRLEIVARETIDLSPTYNVPAQVEEILARQGNTFILFIRERTPAGESLTKTTFPAPLSHQAAIIQPLGPQPVMHMLLLQPENFDNIVQLTSKQMRSGRWKNSTSKGAPICMPWKSQDRGRLEALRQTVFGEKAAKRAQAREEKQEKLQRKMEAMPPDERQAALMQAAMQQIQQMREQHGPPFQGLFDPAGMPPQAAQLHELMQQRLREIEARTRETIAKHPTDPETLRLLEEMITPPEEPDEDASEP